MVTVWGNVVYVSSDSSFIYIDDGSHFADASGIIGIRIVMNGSIGQIPASSVPSVGEDVAITGIVTRVTQSGVTWWLPAVAPRGVQDITMVSQ